MLQSLLLSVQIHYFTSDTAHQRGWVFFSGQETLQLWRHHTLKTAIFLQTMKTAVLCPLKGTLVRASERSCSSGSTAQASRDGGAWQAAGLN